MLKILFFVAIAANVILIVSSGTTSKRQEKRHSSSSANTSSSSSSSSSSENCNEGSSESSSSSNTSSNSNSTSVTNSDDSDDENCSTDNDEQCGPDEQYSKCPFDLCQPQTCAELGFPISCPGRTIDGSCPGKPGCICKDGYLRNCKGKCIPKEQCPSCGGDKNAQAGCGVNCNRHCSDIGKEPGGCIEVCYFNACDCKENYVLDDNTGKCVLPHQCTPTCPKNEIFSNCTNGGCDARNCSQLGKPVPCLHSKDACKEGCVCIDGYLRADNSTCVPKSECPPVCNAPHEVFSDCLNSNCDASECSQLGKPIPCPRLDPSACIKGCVCEEGYVRDSNGKCIPKDQCPSCNDDPNATSGCGTNCGRHCSDHNISSVACPDICILNGCDCKEGYLYDDNIKKCVLPENCTNKCTKPNEVYELCPATCPFRTCGIDDRLIDCVPPPKVGDPKCPPPGCRCKPGFFRDDKAVCKNPNEEYDPCPAPCPAQRCDVDPTVIRCKAPPQPGDPDCEPGCRCKDSYVRNDKGICIPRDQCPKEECPGPNEEYQECPADCSPQTCESRGKVYHCPKITKKNCKPACRCKSGFYRNVDNICVPEDECPKCNGQNEFFACDSACDNVCATLHTQNRTNCPIINVKCNEMCYCKDGYARDSNNVCVPVDQCEANKCTKPNEVYELCPATCPFRTCGIDDRLLNCVPPPKVGDPNCPPPGCRCKPGFFRDDKGNCVEWENCPVCENPNEEYDACPAPCPAQRCDVDPTVIRCKAPPQPGDPECEPGCRCKDSYVRNDKGICIPRDQCPKECPGPNEEYQECPADCSPQTCDSRGKVYHCPKITEKNCKPACLCKSGFYRNADNVCVPEDECPKCTGENEFFACDSACDNVCATLQTQNRTNCPIINKKCNEMCYCKDGYARDSNNVCVPVDHCEECNQEGQCTGANEKYDKCPSCSPQTCESIGKTYNCPLTKDCKPACRCKTGFYRNALNQCISKDDCLKCIGENEFFACDSACDNVCATLHTQNRTHCPILNIKCNDKCYCKDGYARDSNNVCVPIDQCKENQCKENEVYEECPNLCQPQTCDEYGIDRFCPAQNGPNGACLSKPACICKDGYLRNEKGVCIPKEECTTCGGDPNAKPGCGINCNRHCSDYNKEPMACIALCRVNACDCKEGYVFDGNTKKCVKPKDCTPTCQANEVYSECIQGVCRAQNCTEKGEPVPCPDILPGSCKKGCICAENYLRASNGTCVPEDECDVCPEGEVLEKCPPVNCDAYEYCRTSRDDPTECPESKECGKPKCVCSYLERRDRTTGKCVSASQCPPFPCDGPHEEYDSCPPGCPGENCSDYINNSTCPKFRIGVVVPCKPACRCEKGYYRNSKGICVSAEECLDTKCKENERYVDCPSALCQPQKCSEAGFPVKCPKSNGRCPDKPGCVCVEGYLRNSKGVCIPKQDCPSCGGDKWARPGCGVNCGKLCTTYKVKNPVCPAICDLNGCDCIGNTVYDATKKKCVSPDKCPCTTPSPKPTCTTPPPKPACDD